MMALLDRLENRPDFSDLHAADRGGAVCDHERAGVHPITPEFRKGRTASRLAGENLEGVRVIRAFSRQESEVRTFDAAGDELARLTVYVGKISSSTESHYVRDRQSGDRGHCLVWRTLHRQRRFGTGEQIIALVNYMTQTLLALIVLANIIVILTRAVASARRVAQVLEQKTSMEDVPQSAAAKEKAPSIEFSEVSFGITAAATKRWKKSPFPLKKAGRWV